MSCSITGFTWNAQAKCWVLNGTNNGEQVRPTKLYKFLAPAARQQLCTALNVPQQDWDQQYLTQIVSDADI